MQVISDVIKHIITSSKYCKSEIDVLDSGNKEILIKYIKFRKNTDFSAILGLLENIKISLELAGTYSGISVYISLNTDNFNISDALLGNYSAFKKVNIVGYFTTVHSNKLNTDVFVQDVLDGILSDILDILLGLLKIDRVITSDKVLINNCPVPERFIVDTKLYIGDSTSGTYVSVPNFATITLIAIRIHDVLEYACNLALLSRLNLEGLLYARDILSQVPKLERLFNKQVILLNNLVIFHKVRFHDIMYNVVHIKRDMYFQMQSRRLKTQQAFIDNIEHYKILISTADTSQHITDKKTSSSILAKLSM